MTSTDPAALLPYRDSEASFQARSQVNPGRPACSPQPNPFSTSRKRTKSIASLALARHRFRNGDGSSTPATTSRTASSIQGGTLETLSAVSSAPRLRRAFRARSQSWSCSSGAAAMCHQHQAGIGELEPSWRLPRLRQASLCGWVWRISRKWPPRGASRGDRGQGGEVRPFAVGDQPTTSPRGSLCWCWD
jgi:hypothetical protein